MTVWSHPVVLVVLDGVGLRDEEAANAVAQAEKPTLDRLMDKYPLTSLSAHGEAVGLPSGALGGSEVGHMQIGAGRLVTETPKRINESIADDSFFAKDELDDAFTHATKNDGTVHLIGLCSDAYVHSHIKHLKAVLEASEGDDTEVVIHPILDGRDTGPQSAERYLQTITEWVDERDVSFGAMMGRYYGMDRDKNWERTERAYQVLVNQETSQSSSVFEALDEAYADGTTDEFVEPVQVSGTTISSGDSVIMFNFRADRARQLTQCFLSDRAPSFTNDMDVQITTMTRYKDDFDAPVLFERHDVDEPFGSWLADHDISQLRVAESEKKAHVTYFFNGRREEPYASEDRTIFKSPDVPRYDETPAMRAEAITERVTEAIDGQQYGFILANFSNADMIGHTGNMDAAINAVEVVDACLKQIHEAVNDSPYTLLVTADHGNAEMMQGEEKTSHTRNPVPFIVCTGEDVSFTEEENGLYQIAPAILAMNDHIEAKMGTPLFSYQQ